MFIVNLAEVECKKDTSEVLRETIAPFINERLKQIVKYTRDAGGNIVGDGTIKEVRKRGEAEVAGEEGRGFFSF